LQIEKLPKDAQTVMKNRVGDCEICQHSCPWNKKHLDHPLATNMTEMFQKRVKDWEVFFHLSNLIKLTEKKYKEKLGHLNTGIPYDLFLRNVLIAMENAKKLEKG
jgi:epoxyqueuosine reductase QueG